MITDALGGHARPATGKGDTMKGGLGPWNWGTGQGWATEGALRGHTLSFCSLCACPETSRASRDKTAATPGSVDNPPRPLGPHDGRAMTQPRRAAAPASREYADTPGAPERRRQHCHPRRRTAGTLHRAASHRTRYKRRSPPTRADTRPKS